MCTIVRTEDYARTWETEAELAALVGGVDRLVMLGGTTAKGGASCLCPVDTEQTLERAGIPYRTDDWGDSIIPAATPTDGAPNETRGE